MPGMDAMPMEMGESPGGIDKKLSGNHEQKTRFFIKPNLMQLHSSYVVTDPKGTVLVECGKLLSRGSPRLGKDGKPLNFVTVSSSKTFPVLAVSILRLAAICAVSFRPMA